VTVLRVAAVALVVLVASWAVLILLARRLPPGLLKDLAGFLPVCVTTVRRLRHDPRVPPRAALEEAWAGDPRLLERLLGGARS
jgi:hypothetical protein